MTAAEKWTEELKKQIGEERYNKLAKEYSQQYDEERRKQKPYWIVCSEGSGHTCGEYPNMPCEACFEAFPPKIDKIQ
jgi:hypothetical protein